MALGIFIAAALNSVPVTRNLVEELVPTSFLIEVPVEALGQATAGGVVGLDIDIDLIDAEFLLYSVPTPGTDIVFVEEIDVPEDAIVFYRELSEQRSLATLAEEATTVVLAIETRAFRPERAPPFRALVIALDADGNAISSDFRDNQLEDQLRRLSDIVVAEGLDWPTALGELIRAGRDRELEIETESTLGARLLAEIES